MGTCVLMKSELLEKVFGQAFDTPFEKLKLDNLVKIKQFLKKHFPLIKASNDSGKKRIAFSLLGALDSIILDCFSRLISEDQADEFQNQEFTESNQLCPTFFPKNSILLHIQHFVICSFP